MTMQYKSNAPQVKSPGFDKMFGLHGSRKEKSRSKMRKGQSERL